MDEVLFAMPDTTFRVTRGADGRPQWSGEFGGVKIASALPLERGCACIVLLDPDSNGSSSFRNLLCLQNDGGITWRAELPEGNDAYVGFSMENGVLSASSWSGFKVRIDIATGRILDAVFTK